MVAELPAGSLSTARIRTYGRICLWAGILGAASRIYLAVVPPTVGLERYSYPLDVAGFQLSQAWLAVLHVGLIFGLLALRASGALGAVRYGRFGLHVAIAAFALIASTDLWAITAADAAMGSAPTVPLDASFAIASIMASVGLTIAGIAVLRAGRWRGWARYLPLVLGIEYVVPMFLVIVDVDPLVRVSVASTVWMLLFAALGWVLARQA